MTAVDSPARTRPFYGEFAWAYDHLVVRPVDDECAAMAATLHRHGVGPGARVLDACPVDTSGNRPPVALYHGLASTFRRGGFREVARRRPDRPLMRLELND